MKRATITEAKNGLSALIDRVKAGESILITDRGVPVARLAPPTSISNDDEGRLTRLERAGLITRGTGDFSAFLQRAPVETVEGHGIVDLVLEERESGW
ncbi:MAG: type II toxin-antitoxin system Phd/YefM family antitoxin [Candidatus Limnocylindrales bacterium]